MLSKLFKRLFSEKRVSESTREQMLDYSRRLRTGDVTDQEVMDAIYSVPTHYAGFVDPFTEAGMGTPIESSENEFQWGEISTWQLMPISLVSTAVDAGSTPTTVLRRGLTIARVTATGKWAEYDPAQTDGREIARGFLYTGRNMLDPNTGSAVGKNGVAVVFGRVKVGSLFGFDEQARRQLQHRFIFDDLHESFGGPRLVQAKTADYTVVNSTDNNKIFTTQGAAGAVNFTLPATLQRGHVFDFFSEADQNMTITAPANKLVAFNLINATSVAFSTAGNKIGAAGRITVNADATKYLFWQMCKHTLTVA